MAVGGQLLQSLGQANQVSGILGTALQLAGSLMQKQVKIRDTKNPLNVVTLEVTEKESLEMSVKITDKPIANLGSSPDFISRNPTPLKVTGKISNINLDIRGLSPSAIAGAAGSFAPGIASAIGKGKDLLSNFTDFGGDEIDKKIKMLRAMQLSGYPVEVLGLRLDAKKYEPLKKTDKYLYLIESIDPEFSADSGDCVNITITFKNLVGLSKLIGIKKGTIASGTLKGNLLTNLTNKLPIIKL